MHSVHSVHSVHPPCPGRLSELSAWGSVLSALSALSALEDLIYILSELGGGYTGREEFHTLFAIKNKGGSLEVTIQDITAERHYCR